MRHRATNQMIRKLTILLSVFAVLAFCSCVREDIQPCPPLQIMFGVEDRNYDNIDDVTAEGLDVRRGDNEPFRAFVGSLYYVVEDYSTHEIVVEKRIPVVEGDDMRVACEGIDEELPFGRYIVTAWGNLPGEAVVDNDGGLRSSVLHPDGLEGNDIYMVCDTIDYDYDNGLHNVDLRRVNGKMLIEVRNLPADVRWSAKTVDNVAGCVNTRFEYSGAELVRAKEEWNGESRILTDTYLAPSAGRQPSVLDVEFYDDASRTNAVCKPAPVKVPLSRNHITVVRYDYDAETGMCEIFMLVDSRWENIHDLEID